MRAEPLELDILQVLSTSVTSIALAEGSGIAVLADPPQVGDARGLHRLPLPASLRARPGDSDEARIFFGRDNEPRIMGSRRSSSGESAIYWRHVPAGWRDGREEIGQLGSTTRGGLWGSGDCRTCLVRTAFLLGDSRRSVAEHGARAVSLPGRRLGQVALAPQRRRGLLGYTPRFDLVRRQRWRGSLRRARFSNRRNAGGAACDNRAQ